MDHGERPCLTTVDTPDGLFINAVDTRSGTPVFDGVDVQVVTRGNRAFSATETESTTTAFFTAAQLNGEGRTSRCTCTPARVG